MGLDFDSARDQWPAIDCGFFPLLCMELFDFNDLAHEFH